MGNEFDEYEFENLLQDEFFVDDDLCEIGKCITQRLKEDSDFKEQYEQWLEASGYDSWREFYKGLKSEEEAAWKRMFPNGDENDAITDFLTQD